MGWHVARGWNSPFLQPTGKEFLQPLHLFLTSKLSKVGRYGSWVSSYQREAVPGKAKQPARHIRPVPHLVKAPKELPSRMTAQSVILLAQFERKLQTIVHA